MVIVGIHLLPLQEKQNNGKDWCVNFCVESDEKKQKK